MGDIVEVIGERVWLRRSGENFVGRCPFCVKTYHALHVSPARGLFYCFGCKAVGDAAEFVKLAEKRAT